MRVAMGIMERRRGQRSRLIGMAKRIAPDAESLPLNTPEELEAFARGVTSGE